MQSNNTLYNSVLYIYFIIILKLFKILAHYIKLVVSIFYPRFHTTNAYTYRCSKYLFIFFRFHLTYSDYFKFCNGVKGEFQHEFIYKHWINAHSMILDSPYKFRQCTYKEKKGNHVSSYSIDYFMYKLWDGIESKYVKTTYKVSKRIRREERADFNYIHFNSDFIFVIIVL